MLHFDVPEVRFFHIVMEFDLVKSILGSSGAEESVVHRFWSCEQAQVTWNYVPFLVNSFLIVTDPVKWRLPNWQQCLFAQNRPRRFHGVSRYWLLLKGITLRALWIARNDKLLNQNIWN